MKLSSNFSLNEFRKSTSALRAGISNEPTKEHIRNIQLLVNNILQPLRNKIGSIRINSGYRSPELNKLVKGSKKSQHCKGEAADIIFLDKWEMNNKLIWESVLELELPFDQMINEFDFSWIHISYNQEHNRKQLLEAYKESGKTKYRKPKEYKSL